MEIFADKEVILKKFHLLLVGKFCESTPIQNSMEISQLIKN